jgi:multiple sugar transport system ATP-binding protein
MVTSPDPDTAAALITACPAVSAGAASAEAALPAGNTPPARVVLDGVVVRYGARERPALDVDSLPIPGGSLTVIVGPSGSGKSTALRVVSGLEVPDAGRVLIGGTDVTGVAPGRRGVAMVFQDFALYPHMTVERNIGFGLRLAARHGREPGLDRAEIERRVAQACATLGLSGLRHRRPAQLSGGERQRVGLARAIVRRPAVLLLDEPLSALDAQLRHSARAELVRLHRELGNTVVLVTHDQLEALSMATHLVVMDGGRVRQAGTPAEVYRRPVDTFVATFTGTPPMNVSQVTVTDGGYGLAGPGVRASLAHRLAGSPSAVQLGWRPGDGVIQAGDDDAAPTRPGLTVEGVVDVVEFTGDAAIVRCAGPAGGSWAVMWAAADTPPAMGQRVRVRVPHGRLHLFDGPAGRRLPVNPSPEPDAARP